jgi:hypothetical protein
MFQDMLKISFKSARKPNDILKGAKTFFRQEGLKADQEDDWSIGFRDTAGYVSVDVTHEGEVSVETVGWEKSVKQFAERYRSAIA